MLKVIAQIKTDQFTLTKYFELTTTIADIFAWINHSYDIRQFKHNEVNLVITDEKDNLTAR
jgi:hypothetical protein